MRSSPFARALAMMSLIQAAAGNPMELAKLPEYSSRGKGRGQHSGKKWGPRPSGRDMVQIKTAGGDRCWVQKENGVREVARRLRQINLGIIRVVV